MASWVLIAFLIIACVVLTRMINKYKKLAIVERLTELEIGRAHV